MVKNSGFTTSELAKLIGCTNRTIRNMIDRGRFPNAHKLDPDSESSTWIVPFTDYHNYLQKKEIKVPKNIKVRPLNELEKDLLKRMGGQRG